MSKDFFIGLGSDFWLSSIYQSPQVYNLIDAEFIPTSIKLIPLFFSFGGAFLSFLFYSFGAKTLVSLKLSNSGIILYKFLNRKWLFDRIYTEYIAQSVLKFSYHISYKVIDRGIVETFGPYGVVQGVSKIKNPVKNWHSGVLYHYSFSLILFLVLSLSVVSLFKFMLTTSFLLKWFVVILIYLIIISFVI